MTREEAIGHINGIAAWLDNPAFEKLLKAALTTLAPAVRYEPPHGQTDKMWHCSRHDQFKWCLRDAHTVCCVWDDGDCWLPLTAIPLPAIPEGGA